MSIGAIGGVSPVQSNAAVSSAAKPESGEVPGAPDHDGDSDNSGASAAQASASVTTGAGRVNVKA